MKFYSKLALCRYENRNILEVVVHISTSYFVIFLQLFITGRTNKLQEQKKIELKTRVKSTWVDLENQTILNIKHNYTSSK